MNEHGSFIPKLLNARAQNLAVLYDFDYNYGISTIGNDFYAIDNVTWAFRMKRGKPFTKSAMSDYLTKKWIAIRNLKKCTTLRIFDGKYLQQAKGSRTSFLRMTFSVTTKSSLSP